MWLRAFSLPSGKAITSKENVDTTYGERTYVKMVNQYKLLGPIGEGSFSRVFLAVDTNSGQQYAVKRLRVKKLAKTAIGTSILHREMSMLNRVSHPHIISLKEVIYIQQTQVVYFVMQYADCGSLSSLVQRGHVFSPAQIRFIFKQVVVGVACLHDTGIVHQDIKPQNILMTSDGTAMIADLGVGHSFQSSARVFGSPAFQAPEVIDRGNDDVRSPGKEDVWSLGVTLYFLSFGKLPYIGSNVFEVVRSIVTKPVKQPPESDPVLWDLIANMMSVEVPERYDITQVLDHEYVRDAEVVDVQIKPVESIPKDTGLPIRVVQGIVCGEGFEFDQPTIGRAGA